MGRSRDVYRAVVDENHDPQQRGRLQVSVPSVGVSSSWAEACLPPVPMVLLALPTVGSTVWVQFENGDRTPAGVDRESSGRQRWPRTRR